MAMNDVYVLCLCQHATFKTRGYGIDYVILLSQGGWVLITVDYGGGNKYAKNDCVICKQKNTWNYL